MKSWFVDKGNDNDDDERRRQRCHRIANNSNLLWARNRATSFCCCCCCWIYFIQCFLFSLNGISHSFALIKAKRPRGEEKKLQRNFIKMKYTKKKKNASARTRQMHKSHVRPNRLGNFCAICYCLHWAAHHAAKRTYTRIAHLHSEKLKCIMYSDVARWRPMTTLHICETFKTVFVTKLTIGRKLRATQ